MDSLVFAGTRWDSLGLADIRWELLGRDVADELSFTCGETGSTHVEYGELLLRGGDAPPHVNLRLRGEARVFTWGNHSPHVNAVPHVNLSPARKHLHSPT